MLKEMSIINLKPIERTAVRTGAPSFCYFVLIKI